jgi:hypothetical protein
MCIINPAAANEDGQMEDETKRHLNLVLIGHVGKLAFLLLLMGYSLLTHFSLIV